MKVFVLVELDEFEDCLYRRVYSTREKAQKKLDRLREKFGNQVWLIIEEIVE